MCWCNPKLTTVPCCGSSECLVKETKKTVDELKAKVVEYQNKIKDIQSLCKHEYITYEYVKDVRDGYTNESQFDNVEVECIHCSAMYTFYENDSKANYDLAGIIGAKAKIKKEDYEKYIEIQKQVV